MKNLSQQIKHSINEDLTQINNRIKGTAFLEILKFKIIDKLPILLKTKLSRDKEDSSDQFSYEDASRIIDANIIFSNSSKIILNKEIKNDLLIICLSGPITVGIEDYEIKKNIDFNLTTNSGITIPKGSKCSLHYFKNSVILELYQQDKLNNIEN